MTLKKFWRALIGRIDKDELSHVKPYIAPSESVARYKDDDQDQRKLIQRHIDEANSVLFRLRTQQALRRREY